MYLSNLFELISSVSGALLKGILFDYRFLPLYFIIAFLVKAQYGRYSGFDAGIHGRHAKTWKQVLEEMILTGLVSGFAVSLLTAGIGIVISSQALQYMFVIMAVLAVVNIRYICISYAGGLLCVASLVFGLKGIDVSGILCLIGIMHLLESLLIYINAGKDIVPVFIKREDGIAGAFLIHKFWPVPFVFLTLATQEAKDTAIMPAGGWWPLFSPEIAATGAAAFMLDCVVAGLYYSDIAIARQPERKSRETALQYLCYSAVLLFIAFVSRNLFALKLFGALFALLGHESITIFGHYRERLGEPLFRSAGRGVKILDFLPGSHAQKMGMQRGDTILSVNGKDIQTEEGLKEALKDFPAFVWISVETPHGDLKTYEYKCYPEGLNQLGIIPVPREKEVTYTIEYFENITILKNLVAKFRKMNRPM